MTPRGRSGRAPHEGEIAALERALALFRKLRAQAAVRAIVFRNDHQPGRVLVQPVHDFRPLHPADAGEAVAAMRDQCIGERAAGVAGGGMHDQPGRLVDHDQRVVFVDNMSGMFFPGRLGGLGRRHRNRHRLAGIDLQRGIADCAALDRDLARQDQSFQPGDETILQFSGEHAIEPPACVLGRNRHRLDRHFLHEL